MLIDIYHPEQTVQGYNTMLAVDSQAASDINCFNS